MRGLPPPGMYAHAGINREGVEGDDDAARRVVVKTIGPHRWEA